MEASDMSFGVVVMAVLIGRRLGKLEASVGNLNSLFPMAEYRG